MCVFQLNYISIDMRGFICENGARTTFPTDESSESYLLLELKAHCCSYHTMGSSPYLLDW